MFLIRGLGKGVGKGKYDHNKKRKGTEEVYDIDDTDSSSESQIINESSDKRYGCFFPHDFSY